MIVLGGYTRLSQSGLSMVDWHIVTGVLPPLNDAAWQSEFEKYQAYPEYQKVNFAMSIGEFKRIFWVEYSHRMLGRLIGLVFAIGLVWFKMRGKIDAWLRPRIILLFVLGAAQGLLGWYMVKSGLVDRPQVSQYRLTAHLSLAVILYSYLLWVTLRISRLTGECRLRLSAAGSAWLRTGLVAALVLVALMVVSGGFMAGTKAAHVHNTFPTISGEWFPGDALAMQPVWLNAFENVTAIQVIHRYGAALTAAIVLTLALFIALNKPDVLTGRAAMLLAVIVLCQFSLGVATLLLKAPTAVAASHQFMALMLLSAVIFANYRVRQPFSDAHR
jgi:cytochrome c oxidase assembly protein subunit 15